MPKRETERTLMREIMYWLSQLPGVRVFRNNVGQAIQADGRRIRYGLHRGSSDLIGWTSVKITPEMVGHKVAVFTAVEVKTATGRPTKEQTNFIEQVREAGGIAGIARDGYNVQALVNTHLRELRS